MIALLTALGSETELSHLQICSQKSHRLGDGKPKMA